MNRQLKKIKVIQGCNDLEVENMKGDYVIIGDAESHKDCLVCIVGNSYEEAVKALNRMLNNPNENDKRLMSGYTNLRIYFVEEKDCWWNEIL